MAKRRFDFRSNYKAIASELSTASNDSLQDYASNGGWRKAFIDRAHAPLRSWFDIPRMLLRLFAAVISIFPPIGEQYRCALVAQTILDNKGCKW